MNIRSQICSPSSRRTFLKQSTFGMGAFAFSGLLSKRTFGQTGNSSETPSGVPAMLDFESLTYPFALPPLPYAYDALEPYIDARTMEIHYTKHHAGYVRKLNAAIENYPATHSLTLGEMLTDLNAVPAPIQTAVRNNGGGHLNHCLFWYSLVNPGVTPSSPLQATIDGAFGSVDGLLDEMVSTGLGRFGSGWSWLCKNPEGGLVVVSTPNQDTPWMDDPSLRPLLGVDVWEHAYYLKYQNRRGDYLNAWKNIVDWSAVDKRLRGAA